MKKIFILTLVVVAFTISQVEATATTFDSPVEPESCPPFKWMPDPVVVSAYTPYFWNGSEWVITDHVKHPWLFFCKVPPFEPPSQDTSHSQEDKPKQSPVVTPMPMPVVLPVTGQRGRETLVVVGLLLVLLGVALNERRR